MPARDRFGYNQPPHDAIVSSPPMPPTTAAFPFSYDSSSDVVNAQHAAAQRNMAQISSGPVDPILPLQNATVTVSSPPVAGAAPAEIGATLGGEGGMTIDAQIQPAVTSRKVIRNKTQVIREAGLLITVLEDALRYQPGVHRNAPAPELWHQLNLEDRAAHDLISELVAELKKLNAFLASHSRATDNCKAVQELQKVGLNVLKTYGNTVAVGAGLLTLGLLCTLLQHLGAGEVVEAAMLWKKIGH